MLATERLNRLPAAERGITLGDYLLPVRVGERMSSRVRNLTLVAAGALLIAFTANFSFPVPGSPVPVTGQTFAVLLVGGALGFRRGVSAAALYVVMGFWLPVYAQHASGFERIASFQGGSLVLGATGGYLLGFIVASAVVGRLAELGWDRTVVGAVSSMAIGNALIYAIGLPWLAAALPPDVAGGPVPAAIRLGLLPFLLGDIVKLILAGLAFPAAWWIVGRRPDER